MNRIDGLEGDAGERLVRLTGQSLDRSLDGALQELVRRTSVELGVPIGLVSLVLARTQFFRAQVGLPPDLAAVRATDRDASFCQFVVRDRKAFEVTDAQTDPRVPQDLVQRYGIRAYLGEPVLIGGAVVGSLCAIDLKPREFTTKQRETLKGLAGRVSERLEQLANPVVTARLLERATAPAFAELRNLLSPMHSNLAFARVAVTELAALSQLFTLPRDQWAAAPVAGAIGGAADALTDLTALLAEMEVVTERVAAQIFGLERALARGTPGSSAAQVIASASTLSLHHTKLVGGGAWPPINPVKRLLVSEIVGAAALSTCLSMVSNAMREARLVDSRLHVEASESPVDFAVLFSARGLSQVSIAAIAAELKPNLGSDTAVWVEARGESLVLQFACPDEPR